MRNAESHSLGSPPRTSLPASVPRAPRLVPYALHLVPCACIPRPAPRRILADANKCELEPATHGSSQVRASVGTRPTDSVTSLLTVRGAAKTRVMILLPFPRDCKRSLFTFSGFQSN